jgi:D-lactate dehydrogenase
MRIAFFSVHDFERPYYPSSSHHEMKFFNEQLNIDTVNIADGYPAVACFAHDKLNATVLEKLYRGGTRLIALRSAGFNHVDLPIADKLGLVVARVPRYSPNAIAEHAVALIMTLNRKTHRAYLRVRENNFSLEGLKGFDLVNKTVGVIGTGNIGSVFCNIMKGFGCKVIAYDPVPNPECIKNDVEYLSLPELYQNSDIISLHCPLNETTHHIINDEAIQQMKAGVMIINTSRGAIIDTTSVIKGLKSKQIGYLGIDVYEEEEHLFFADHSQDILTDDIFARLQTFSNVLITAHQGFFTHEALQNIAQTTMANIDAFESGKGEIHLVSAKLVSQK